MRALTIWQPWASLIAVGAKMIETRSWATNYRGEVAIHAAKHSPGVSFDDDVARRVIDALGANLNLSYVEGAILATAHLVVCERIKPMPTDGPKHNDSPGVLLEDEHSYGWVCEYTDEYAFGDYTPGRFAWIMRCITALKEPIPCTGAQGLWTVPEELAQRIREDK